jgi:prepilin-type N-terminal cleavage/methylation domain-containing protein
MVMGVSTRRGFTLLEMSIVIAIVGLIIGAIAVGSSMVQMARLRSVVTEYGIYLKAIKEFQDKYMALPGDMTNATTFWGAAGTCPIPYTTTASTATCNGDGSGTIGSSTTAGVLSKSSEWWTAWQQLADAGLIPGSFTGAPGWNGANEANLGVNVPASKFKGAGWTLFYYLFPNNGTNSNTNSSLWTDQYGHLLALGGYASGTYTNNGVLLPSEAESIDQKIDDGLPGTGKVRAWRTSVPQTSNPFSSCTINDTSQTAQAYNNDVAAGINAYNKQVCALVFLLGF